jgi:redox-sensitive bicupin YhaK (pirin superfamily)
LPTVEGAGVHLKRAIGFQGSSPELDPFLLLDDFHSHTPSEYLPGFPWHPHRGMETVTYVLEGTVAHGDSMGNQGTIGTGDMQWMTAGSGIIHQEMPKGGADGHTALAYVLKGAAHFDEGSVPPSNTNGTGALQREPLGTVHGPESVILYEREGDEIVVSTKNEGAHFILVTGQPIGEPVAWAGPIVMNTQEELDIAFQEYREGTFVKK